MWPRSLQNRRWGRADAMRRLGGFLRFGGSSARILIGPSPWRLAHPTSHLHPPEYYHGQYSYEISEHDDDGRDPWSIMSTRRSDFDLNNRPPSASTITMCTLRKLNPQFSFEITFDKLWTISVMGATGSGKTTVSHAQ